MFSEWSTPVTHSCFDLILTPPWADKVGRAHPPRISFPSVDAASENTQNLLSSGLKKTAHISHTQVGWSCTSNTIATVTVNHIPNQNLDEGAYQLSNRTNEGME